MTGLATALDHVGVAVPGGDEEREGKGSFVSLA